MKDIVPISQLGRAPEQGRIRYGIRSKGIPRSITKFRFTSSDLTALDQIAKIYGGDIALWDKGQSEVITHASEISVVLPPNPLSQHYELWKGSSCVRRCDGITAEIPVTTPDGSELVETPCICQVNNSQDCKVTTRLRVILPEIRWGGVWRMDCKGWFGAQELPSMVRGIEAAQSQGLFRAKLALEQRQKANKKFIVPMLRLEESVNEIMARTGRELGNGETIRAIGSGSDSR